MKKEYFARRILTLAVEKRLELRCYIVGGKIDLGLVSKALLDLGFITASQHAEMEDTFVE